MILWDGSRDGSGGAEADDRLIATATATTADELRAARHRKRSAASRAFRRAVSHTAAALP